MAGRIPLLQEPITGLDAVSQYDRGAKHYMMPEYRYFTRKIISRGITGGRVLDIGTGSGLLAIELCKAKGCDFEIVAVDISENMLDRAVGNAKEAGVGDRIKFFNATAAALPFEDESFDLVISYASLHHWFDPVKVFNEAERVVKQTGKILIRDNKRVYDRPLWKPFIWLMSRFMNKRHRDNWPKAIMAGYTIPEVRQLLTKSNLNDYRVQSDFVFIDLCIESPGK